MARSSGIGTYIREVLPRIAEETKNRPYTVLGDVSELDRIAFPDDSMVEVSGCTVPIYSLREQVQLAARTPPDTSLFWSPHYNIPLLFRGKLLVTVHDTLHLAHPEFVRGRHRRLYARRMFAEVRRRAAAILCDSHFTADELVRLTGVDRARLFVVHLGVAPAWFCEIRGEPPWPRPYFMFLGNVKPHKNLRTLCAAFRQIADEVPHDLVIVGKKEGFISGDSTVLESASALGGRLHFTGELTEGRVRQYVENAAALVIPSFYEGFGLPAVEAMAAGSPVIAARAASLPEVCGEGALYFDPRSPTELAAAMRRIVRDRTLRADLIGRGKERARGFDWDRCARETLAVIDHLLEG